MSSTLNTIPASFFVNVTPGVIPAGPGGLTLVELMLTLSDRIPIGQVLSFPSSAAVGAYFGQTSLEATEASVYFAGYTGRTQSPAALLFAQYPEEAVGAWMRGGNISGLTLNQLHQITGILEIPIDGSIVTSASIDLSTAGSFSQAAQIITAALGTTGPTEASFDAQIGASFTATGSGITFTVSAVTGTIFIGDEITGTGVTPGTTIETQVSGTVGGAGVYTTSAATTASAAACTTASEFMVVGSTGSGLIAAGQQVIEASVITPTFVAAQISGETGGVGVYQLTLAWNIAETSFTTIQPTVTYDTLSGGFLVVSSTTGPTSTIGYASGSAAAPLLLTQSTGAVLSQGAAAAVPATFMDAIVNQTVNFATFQTLFDPDGFEGNTVKQEFSAWTNAQNNRFAYLCEDDDATPTESQNASTSLGRILRNINSSGTNLNWVPSVPGFTAAFVGGYAASINFDATNGRATADFKSQTGFTPTVTSQIQQSNLIANGYNSYVSVATGGAGWQFYDNGSVSGPFTWLDTYLNQIWLNNQCQIALMDLLTRVGTIPYNPAGYGLIRSALTAGAAATAVTLPPPSPVAAALNNGVIQPGVVLSADQVLEVNTLSGQNIAETIQTNGWALVIQPATAQVRAARSSPTIILFYTDGGSIQRINLSSYVIL